MVVRPRGPTQAAPRRARSKRLSAVLAAGLTAGLLAGVPAGTSVAAEPEAAVPLSLPARTALARETVEAFDRMFSGPHAGARAVHAKGVLAEGLFLPSLEAEAVSLAPHFRRGETPVLVRFSNFPGRPGNRDGEAGSGPRGMAVKFMLEDGGDTDLVAHSYDGFPAATPEAFLRFLRAAPEPGALAALAAREPAVRAFLDAELPAPESYARLRYHGVNAFLFTNAAGLARHGRYRIEPVAGQRLLAPGEAASREPGYLGAELAARLEAGPASFDLDLQLAGEGDDPADGSRPWPAERPRVRLGRIVLERLVEDEARQRAVLFTPLNLVPGISASPDPMLDARTRSYRLSHARRAPEDGAGTAAGTATARAEAVP